MSLLPTSVPVPWEQFNQFGSQVQSLVKCDSLALGLVTPRKPDMAAFIGLHRVTGQQLGKWVDSGYRNDDTFKKACQKGLAAGKSIKSRCVTPLPPGQNVLVVTQPASLSGSEVWYLALGRKRGGFDDADQQAAKMLLQLVQMGFDHVPEPGMGRLIMTNDGRVIHADPSLERVLNEYAKESRDFLDEIQQLVPQRWPEIAAGEVHDMALELADQHTWVRLIQGETPPTCSVAHWYLELRPLDEDDVPPAGLMDDERVAIALGYLDDQYAEVPSLTELGEYIELSPFHFQRLFTTWMDISPKHYLLRKQLQMAKWMLRAGRKSIGDIALATGFASHGHFTATFHRMVGISPREYRDQFV